MGSDPTRYRPDRGCALHFFSTFCVAQIFANVALLAKTPSSHSYHLAFSQGHVTVHARIREFLLLRTFIGRLGLVMSSQRCLWSSNPDICHSHVLQVTPSNNIWSRTEFSTHLFQRWTPKSRISLTRRHGGNTLALSSLPQRCGSYLVLFVFFIHCVVIELDVPRNHGGQWLHLDQQVL